MTLKQFQAAFFFYQHYWFTPLLLSVLCLILYRANGTDLWTAVACKMATNALVWFFIITFLKGKLYYYYNLHISKNLLLVSYFIIDLFLFGIGLWITHSFL